MALAIELAALTDEDLMVRLKHKEYPAFVTLFDRYRHTAVSFGVRMLADSDAAEGVASAAFQQVVKSVNSFNPRKTGFRVWFFALMRGLIHKHALIGKTDSARLESATDIGPIADVNYVAGRQAEARHLFENLGKLKPIYREVVYLRRFEKMSYADIARITGEKPATAKSRMNYAIENLRKAVSGKV